MKLSMIVARSMDNVIGINNDIPWKCPADLANFKDLTSDKAIAMGRNTWDSLPKKPLPNRFNIIVTSSPNEIECTAPGVGLPVKSIEEAIAAAKVLGVSELVFIGGKAIYEEAVKIVDEVYLSEMNWCTLSDNVTGPEDQKVYFDYHFDYGPDNPDQTWTLVENWQMLESGTGNGLFEFLHLKRK